MTAQEQIRILEAEANEIEAEAGRYGQFCPFTQKQLTSIRKEIESLRIGRIQFASAGATRPKNMCNRHGVVNCKRCG